MVSGGMVYGFQLNEIYTLTYKGDMMCLGKKKFLSDDNL